MNVFMNAHGVCFNLSPHPIGTTSLSRVGQFCIASLLERWSHKVSAIDQEVNRLQSKIDKAVEAWELVFNSS